MQIIVPYLIPKWRNLTCLPAEHWFPFIQLYMLFIFTNIFTISLVNIISNPFHKITRKLGANFTFESKINQIHAWLPKNAKWPPHNNVFTLSTQQYLCKSVPWLFPIFLPLYHLGTGILPYYHRTDTGCFVPIKYNPEIISL